MPRLPELTPQTAPAPVREMMQAQTEVFGFVLNPTKLLGYCPEIAAAQSALGLALDRGEHIEARLRYLVYAKVASLNGCPF
jgi:alkylhydroperoxidase family enzyme